MQEKHSPSRVLWCRGLFLPLSHLLTDHSFESLQHPAGLSQLERGVGCRQNQPCCPKWLYCFLHKQCIGFVQRFLSNKMNVNIYKLSWQNVTYSTSQELSSIKQEGDCFALIWEQQEENRRWRAVICSCLGTNSAQHGEEGSWRTGIMMCEFSELWSYWLTFSTKASLSLKDTQLASVVRQM